MNVRFRANRKLGIMIAGQKPSLATRLSYVGHTLRPNIVTQSLSVHSSTLLSPS